MCQINAATLQQRILNGEKLNLLDVRETFEFATYNIGGQNIPVSKLTASIEQLNYNKTDEIIVICTAGIRSENARGILSELGYQNVLNLKGGLIALRKINNK
ncbi:rhodanese-like domain-containing protein [Mucilaginibacter pedocola]|uniref:Rhodanese n=1 Tax=Mucilaginibacter pedocola TaxID=1792845 RepID=A0A1S9PFI8_9SPHI|nr:rhodanese-like domain-containing protein [Mucilaginibacter pedocola]OOQ59734.1 rhodanese [Mucilaginibacter pedocola]